ncbi:Uncharacterised protein [uncultured archaeon]|nr:Uncharacterised protein [uncultured archaeon]
MKPTTFFVVCFALVLGLFLGIVWMPIFDSLKLNVDNFYIYFVLPFVLSLLVAIGFFFMDNETTPGKKFLHSLIIFILQGIVNVALMIFVFYRISF